MSPAVAASSRPEPAVDAGLVLRQERVEDAAEALALIDRAFGPGRYSKVSERLREGNRQRRDLSVCALLAGRLVGAVRLWPVQVGDQAGAFLGPIAVEASFRGAGVGASLVQAAARAADAAGEPFILLVGDPAFFNPLGFVEASSVKMPGPVDPRRVLIRLAPGIAAQPSGAARTPDLRPS